MTSNDFGLRLIACVVMVVCGATSNASDDRDPAIDRLRNLGTALQTRSVWTASYRQEYTPSGMSIGEIVEGQVWLAWPDRALFATGNPVQRWMGLAGLEVRLLDLENGACDDHVLTVEEWERIPLVAVLEPGRAMDRFSVAAVGERGLSLTPREPGGVDKVSIEIGADGLPLTVVVLDPQGASSSFAFTNWHSADTPPEGAWLPAPPEGIDCIAD